MVVCGLRNATRPPAKRTGNTQLGVDRPADELTFVGQLIQKIRQLIFHLERNDRRFCTFACHQLLSIRIVGKDDLREQLLANPPQRGCHSIIGY